MKAVLNDLTGRVFTRWTVLSRAENSKKGSARWHCRCSCGNEKVVVGYCLSMGGSKSCGCLSREVASICNRKHGKTGSRAFTIWSGMLARCFNPNSKWFHRYGGRGIKVCERWRKFENFLADMGEPPPKAQIDRRDNDGDYEPNNCRWATSKTNNRNRSNNTLITINGQTKCLAEWCEFLKLQQPTVCRRRRRGMSWEQALEPVERRNRSGRVGVCWVSRRNCWRASIGKRRIIGFFKDFDLACAAREAAEKATP